MTLPGKTEQLPAFVALATLPVLAGAKRGTSVQLSTTHFENWITVLTGLDEERTQAQVEALRDARAFVGDLNITVESVATEPLLTAAEGLQEELRDLSAVADLRARYPGDCVVVPEFLRTETQISVGARLYFFRADKAPSASEILRRNVTNVVEDDQRAFKRYQGALHGYPDCCIEQFTDRQPGSPSPEQRSVRPLDSHIHDHLLGTSPDVSIQQIVPEFFELESAYAFCSRKFYPGPECRTAQRFGRTVFETLTTEFELDETLVRDHYRLNFALCVHLAESLATGPGEPPRWAASAPNTSTSTFPYPAPHGI